MLISVQHSQIIKLLEQYRICDFVISWDWKFTHLKTWQRIFLFSNPLHRVLVSLGWRRGGGKGIRWHWKSLKFSCQAFHGRIIVRTFSAVKTQSWHCWNQVHWQAEWQPCPISWKGTTIWIYSLKNRCKVIHELSLCSLDHSYKI